MKHVINIFFILFSIGISTLFAQSDTVTVRVDGLSCPFCAYGLEKKLNEIDGVDSINIDIEKGSVTLTVGKGTNISEEKIKSKVKDAGFTPREVTFSTKKNTSGKEE